MIYLVDLSCPIDETTLMANEFEVEAYGTGWRVIERAEDGIHHFGIYHNEAEAIKVAEQNNKIRAKLASQFERYEVLANGQCKVTCEFGTWTARDKQWAEGAVSKVRYANYWSTIGACDVRRGQ